VPEVCEAFLHINDSFRFAVIGDILLVYPDDSGVTLSPVLRGCTVSRIFDGANMETGAVLLAEEAIGEAAGEELRAIQGLVKDNLTSENLGIGGHYRLWHGLTLRQRGLYDDACHEFLAAQKTGVRHWRVNWYLAQSAYRAGNLTLALKALDEVRQAAPGFTAPKDLAEELAAAAGSDNSPSRPTVSGRLALAKFFENNGRYEEALAETDLVIASGTMDPTIHYQFAQLLIVTGRIDKSIPALNTVVSLNPRHTYAHNDLGVIYLQQGRQDEAISAFECAVSADNHNLNALRNLLGVVIAGGNREGAMAVIRQLLAAYPGDKGLEGVTKEFGLPLDMAAGALKNPPSSGGAPEGEAEAFRKKAADYYEEMTALYEADSPENPARQLVHPVWKAQLDTLGALILEGIPENFLFHPICLEMFVRGGWQKQQEYELQYLEGLDGPLRDRIFSVPETAVGHLPRNCPGHDISINTLGMLWYCARIQERLTGEISSVVEFGGGFGSFARAFNLLMEKPLTYSIIDLPEMLALQLYYLGLSLGEERVVAHKDTAEPPAAGKVNLYPVYGIAQSSLSADLFVSTFALSETPAFTQDFVCRTRDFFGAPRVYITGQLESERTELGWQKPQGIVISALHRYRHLELNHFHIGANYELIGSDEESRPLGAAERGRSLSATPGDSRQRDPEKPVGIIFSKDRAMQLDCTLSSLSLHCRDMAGLDMHVLYATSDLLHERQYEELKKVYPAITFVKERMFKEDLSSLLRGRKYVLFLVDDNIFVNDFNAADAVKGLDEDPEALGFSLRLGRNTTYCYMLNKAQALPPFRTAGKKVLGFDWTAAELDFGYPLEVSSSFYRVEDLLPLMALDYKNPNTLELMFDSNKHIFRDRKKSLLCFESSVTFCNPVNMVQTMWVNRAGGKGDYSPLKLAEMFDRGLRVDAGAYSGLVPKGCHQEVDFIFSGNREAPPGPNPERPLVSVMIISYNGIDHIKPCIESIQRNTDEDYEIVVVDNARNDGSIDYLRTVPGLTLVENPTNIGYSPARAQAMALVRGDYIVSIDDDTVVTKGWVRRFIDHAKAHPELGIIGPMSNYVSNAQLVQNAVYHNVHEMDTFAETLSRENEGRLTYTNKLIGFCMFIPRKVLETIGCIDYNFGAFFGFDDDDYSLRAQAAGFKLAIAHDIFIHHTGGPQGKGDAAYNQSLLGAWEIFKKKWDLPSDLPYGQPYSVGHILEGPFDKKRHFIPAPDPKELEPLIYRGAATRSVIPTSATDDGELLGRKVDDAFASAKAAADRGNWEEAASIFGRLIEEYPDLGVAHAGLGSVLVAMKEYDRAIIVLSKTLEMLPTEMEVWNQLATAFLLSGRGANAIEVLENALSIEPDNVELLTATAGLCLSEKEYGKAITWVSNAIERDPGCVEAISLLGRISIEIGDGEAAKVVLEKLNKVTPGHPVIFEMEEAMGLKPSGQAEEEASEEGKESGESIVDLYNQAILSYEKGETDGALRQFEKILEMDKEKPEVLNDAGVLYFQKGDKDKAVSYLREAVRLDPENFDYLRNLADICLDSGKVDEAAGHYGDILRKEPENVEVMVIAAQLCFGAGLEEDARVYMDRVREIDPDNEFIRQNIVAQA
jgi:tetratricopeptide (TPR) repeat protein/GT2 family glycosyltransferase